MLGEIAYQRHQNFNLFLQVNVSSSSWHCLFHPTVIFFAVLLTHLQLQLLSLSKIQKQMVTIQHVIPKPQFHWCFQHLQKE
jgi:hypothetical protein